MNKAISINKQGRLEVLSLQVPYAQDPTRLFHTLCENKTDSLLLESAEIDSKQDLQSLLIVDSAVRIVCEGHKVRYEALTTNGVNLLNIIAQNIAGDIEHTLTDKELVVQFEMPDDTLDEDSRLREASSFDALRLVQHSFDLSGLDKNAIFMGGLFAYDIVANFEPLGDANKANQCPDFVFYVAESLLVVDHQKESCDLQTTLFNHDDAELARIRGRITEISQQCENLKWYQRQRK
ncbi:anthranilate synthase aminase component [Vibrio variabilis]|uniref:Anthranilate synthase aminase component n=1 Tax=Vibrio variabilis TaxID=990271 RepID=A0ABQ0JAC1_9VIBR|nr:anthranilate synthase aminase component [Vibrio variabilis]